jgi:sulfur-oxidizing protein SoxX
VHADAILPQTWLPMNTAMSPNLLAACPATPQRGLEIMVDRGLGNCIACHAVTALSDLPFHGEVGPSLDGVADRWTEHDLRGIVANAKNVFPER